jgi:hypothetical protein
MFGKQPVPDRRHDNQKVKSFVYFAVTNCLQKPTFALSLGLAFKIHGDRMQAACFLPWLPFERKERRLEQHLLVVVVMRVTLQHGLESRILLSDKTLCNSQCVTNHMGEVSSFR